VLPDTTVSVSLNSGNICGKTYVGYISACPCSTHGLILKRTALNVFRFVVGVVPLMALRIVPFAWRQIIRKLVNSDWKRMWKVSTLFIKKYIFFFFLI
jgi:hypothetical protein